MSSQERIDIQARSGRTDPSSGRTGTVARLGNERLPRPPGRRSPGLAVIAVLLIVFGAAVAGLLATRIDTRVPVLVASREVDVGHQFSADDLAVAEVASSGVSVINANQAARVIGQYADTTITPGQLIDSAMLTTSSLLTQGNAAVGISLAAGRFPASGLKSGDIVQVVRTTNGVGHVLVDQAVVGTVQNPGGSVFGSSSSGGNTVVTVIVSDQMSPAVAAAAANTQVSLVLIKRGGTVGGG